MYVPFNSMPPQAKIWIYQSNRPFTTEEQELVSALTYNFVDQWQAHGTDLKATFNIFYKRFIVLAVDETGQNITGCSIDASVHTIKEIEKNTGVELFNRMDIAFKDDNGMVMSCAKAEFKELIKNNDVNPNTIVFNNMVTTMADFTNQWEVPASKSWHAKMFTQTT